MDTTTDSEINYGSMKEYVCPVCGEVYNNNGDTVAFDISIYDFGGHYCLKCWAKWISENIPKLVEK